MVKNLPTMQETQVRSVGQEDPLEKGDLLPTPVFLPGEFHGQRSLVGYGPWGCKELDTTEQLTLWCFLGGSDGKESACRNPWTEESSGLQSMGLQRI